MKIPFIFSGVFLLAGILSVKNARAESQHLSGPALEWDASMKYTNVPEGTPSAHFVFYFTNVAEKVNHTVASSIEDPATGTAFSADSVMQSPVTIQNVHPSCGCTTAQLPPIPWTLAPGTNGQIGVTVNLAGKYGTVVKSVHVGTDEGAYDLIVQITIVRQSIKPPTDAERMRQMEIAHADRQAVFRNDCAACHVKPGQSKYGKDLFDADCAICHEAQHRASMVADLHTLTVPTNYDFWHTWIAHGKPGTFMPAFSTAEGGPLSDMQITSLADYLNSAIPSRVRQMR
jgi:mono/diheme cytochrome c family protein